MKQYTFVIHRNPWYERLIPNPQRAGALMINQEIKTVFIVRVETKYAYKTARNMALQQCLDYDLKAYRANNRAFDRGDGRPRYPERRWYSTLGVQTEGYCQFIRLPEPAHE